MTEYKITKTVSVSDDALWEGTFGTAGESWEWWAGIEFDEGSGWDKPGGATLIAIDPDYPELRPQRKHVTVNDVRRAFRIVLERDQLPSAYDPLDPEQWDAIASDLILQTMMYGGVIFG